jgi:hypothetical protein
MESNSCRQLFGVHVESGSIFGAADARPASCIRRAVGDCPLALFGGYNHRLIPAQPSVGEQHQPDRRLLAVVASELSETGGS